MKILVDMNMSPLWVQFLKLPGFDAVHWASAGPASATDAEIMDFAARHGQVILTHDLDFGALLARRRLRHPSVIQLRTDDVLPGAIGDRLVRILIAAREELSRGALVTVDFERQRIRLLPIDRSLDAGPAPRLEILGVHRLDVTLQIFAAQLPMYGDEAQCRDHFSSVVLIECVVYSPGNFDLIDFTQRSPSRQAPWDEGLLSPDGEQLLARSLGCVMGDGPLRFAFYMHYWDPALPLIWSHGEIDCPAATPMPERLKRLMPYRYCG